MAVDRFSEGYEPNFDIDAAVGRQGELLWGDIRAALRDGSAEVKTDEKALFTGNVWIEYQCLRKGEWVASGVSATSSEVWVHVIGAVAVVAPCWQVREMVRQAWKDGLGKEMTRGSHPTRGVVIPISQLLQRLQNVL